MSPFKVSTGPRQIFLLLTGCCEILLRFLLASQGLISAYLMVVLVLLLIVTDPPLAPFQASANRISKSALDAFRQAARYD